MDEVTKKKEKSSQRLAIKSSYEYLNQPDQVAAFTERNAALKLLGKRIRKRTSKRGNKYGVVSSLVDVFSENVRMSATLWKPMSAFEAPEGSFPAILLCHGWGGIRDHLDARFAFEFAKAGFVALTFDYRGWNDSDGVIYSTRCEEQQNYYRNLSKDDLEQAPFQKMEAKIVRETIDMEWQQADIEAAFYFLDGETVVDSSRIGLWGISQGGGHVISVGAKLRDRVRAIVAHVPSCGKVGAGSIEDKLEIARQTAINQARGRTLLPQSVRKHHLDGMDGSPLLSKLATYTPLETAHLINCPILVIDVQNEEMFDNIRNGRKAYEVVKKRNPDSKYELLPGRHYDAYDGSLNQFNRAATIIIQFYRKILGLPNLVACL